MFIFFLQQLCRKLGHPIPSIEPGQAIRGRRRGRRNNGGQQRGNNRQQVQSGSRQQAQVSFNWLKITKRLIIKMLTTFTLDFK